MHEARASFHGALGVLVSRAVQRPSVLQDPSMPPIAADYPFMNILWSMLIFMAFIMWIWIAIMIFADIFRRRDIGGFTKAVWVILIIFIPLFGALDLPDRLPQRDR